MICDCKPRDRVRLCEHGHMPLVTTEPRTPNGKPVGQSAGPHGCDCGALEAKKVLHQPGCSIHTTPVTGEWTVLWTPPCCPLCPHGQDGEPVELTRWVQHPWPNQEKVKANSEGVT